MPPKQYLGHKFAIAVKADFEPVRNGQLKPFRRLIDKGLALLTDNGSVSIQLINARGQISSFYYDRKANYKKRMKRVGLIAMATGAITVGTYYAKNTYVKAAGVASFFLFPVVATSHGRGTVRRRKTPVKTDVTLSVSITPDEFRQMHYKLNDLVKKRQLGIYSNFFNNCATYALHFAKAHGYSMPTPAFPTPVTTKVAFIRECERQSALAGPVPITG